MSAAKTAEVIDLAQAAGAPIARVYGEPMLELPQDLYIPPEALEIFLETFEGPLDLLLYLIRKQNINVLDIPMAELTRQYLHLSSLVGNHDDEGTGPPRGRPRGPPRGRTRPAT